MKERDLPINYAAVLIDVACELGASREALISTTGLQDQDLVQPGGRLAEEKFRQLVTAAITATGKKSLVLHFGQRLALTPHGVFGYPVISCRNIHQVIDILTRYYRQLLNNPSLLMKTEGQQVIVEYQPAREQLLGRRQDTELFFAGVATTLKHLLAADQIPAEIELGYAPPAHQDEGQSEGRNKSQEEYQSVFNCPVKFNQKISRMIFPLSLMSEKPEHASPALLKLYQQQCAELLARVQSSDGLRVKVGEFLTAAKQHFPSLEQAASHFHMSPRTFRRRLSDEGVSFQRILDEVRRVVAETYLRNPALTVNHTADLLGFHDVSNFRRAFIRWSDGVSPSEFKKQQTQPKAGNH